MREFTVTFILPGGDRHARSVAAEGRAAAIDRARTWVEQLTQKTLPKKTRVWVMESLFDESEE